MRKYILYIVIILQIALIVSLMRGIQLSKRSSVRIEDMKETKRILEEEKRKLESEREYVSSEYYLEKVARDELHLSKPGETVVIVPEGMIMINKEQEISNIDKERANWQKWLGVLSGRN